MSDPYNTPQQQAAPIQPQQAPQTDGFAITSMVLGIIAVITCYFGIILGTVAVVFGHLSIKKIRKNPNLGGKGMAIAGLVCGYIGIAITLVFGIFLLAAGNQIVEEVNSELRKQQEMQNQTLQEEIENSVSE